MRWVEDQYETQEQALASIVTEIGIPSMFDEGKVVYTYGIPKCHSDLAPYLLQIPGQILFIIIAKPNKTYSLYKSAKKMEDAGSARIDEARDIASLSQSQKIEWIKTRAEAIGASINDGGASLLLDMYGFLPNKLHAELSKLRSFTDDGEISIWLIERACYATGDCEIKRLVQMITQGQRDESHEMLTRLLARREDPMAIMGFMMQWINKLCIVSDGYNEEKKKLAAQMIKWKKKDDKKKQDQEAEGEDEEVQISNGEPVALFPNLGALYHSFEEFQVRQRQYGAEKAQNWAFQTLLHLGCTQYEIRKAGSDWKRKSEIMHAFVDNIIGE